MPNHLLMWEAMQWAKARGCDSFDLWGIPEEVGRLAAAGQTAPIAESTAGLWGVYRFKRGFADQIRYYAGAHDYVYSRAIYGVLHRVMVAKAAGEQSGTPTGELVST
jgi:lipid II:glycine glycyltransferase (peptidoglycan interpeptide bridge formation enzyme)